MRYGLLVISMFSISALAQQATPDLIIQYKTAISKGCREQAARQRFSVERGDQICSCISKTLEQEVSSNEWRQLTELAMRGKLEEEGKIMGKHIEKTLHCHRAS